MSEKIYTVDILKDHVPYYSTPVSPKDLSWLGPWEIWMNFLD